MVPACISLPGRWQPYIFNIFQSSNRAVRRFQIEQRAADYRSSPAPIPDDGGMRLMFEDAPLLMRRVPMLRKLR